MNCRIRLFFVFLTPFFVALASAAVVGAVLFNVVSTIKVQHDVLAIVKHTRAVSTQVLECTTASPVPPPQSPQPDNRPAKVVHECYESGNSRTGQAVGRITDADQNGVLDSSEIKASLDRIEAEISRRR